MNPVQVGEFSPSVLTWEIVPLPMHMWKPLDHMIIWWGMGFEGGHILSRLTNKQFFEPGMPLNFTHLLHVIDQQHNAACHAESKISWWHLCWTSLFYHSCLVAPMCELLQSKPLGNQDPPSWARHQWFKSQHTKPNKSETEQVEGGSCFLWHLDSHHPSYLFPFGERLSSECHCDRKEKKGCLKGQENMDMGWQAKRPVSFHHYPTSKDFVGNGVTGWPAFGTLKFGNLLVQKRYHLWSNQTICGSTSSGVQHRCIAGPCSWVFTIFVGWLPMNGIGVILWCSC